MKCIKNFKTGLVYKVSNFLAEVAIKSGKYSYTTKSKYKKLGKEMRLRDKLMRTLGLTTVKEYYDLGYDPEFRKSLGIKFKVEFNKRYIYVPNTYFQNLKEQHPIELTDKQTIGLIEDSKVKDTPNIEPVITHYLKFKYV